MPSENERRELVEVLQQVLGEKAAATLMESLHPEPWNQLATKADVLGTKADVLELRGEVAEFRAEFVQFRGEMRAAFAGIVPKLAVASLGIAGTFWALMLAGVAVLD